MDILKIIETAAKLGLPGLAGQAVDIVEELHEAAKKAGDVLDHATRAELDFIHNRALAAADELDGKLEAAERA